MQATHVIGLGSIAAEEFGAPLAHIDAIDKDLEARGAGRKARGGILDEFSAFRRR